MEQLIVCRLAHSGKSKAFRYDGASMPISPPPLPVLIPLSFVVSSIHTIVIIISVTAIAIITIVLPLLPSPLLPSPLLPSPLLPQYCHYYHLHCHYYHHCHHYHHLQHYHCGVISEACKCRTDSLDQMLLVSSKRVYSLLYCLLNCAMRMGFNFIRRRTVILGTIS